MVDARISYIDGKVSASIININQINIKNNKIAHYYCDDDEKTLCGLKVKKRNALGTFYCDCKKCLSRFDAIKKELEVEYSHNIHGLWDVYK